jgi:putative protein-disulfide isomerase
MALVTPKPTLVYGFDPLCGWCFAFRGVLKELRAALGDRVQWEIACGVLVTRERMKPIGEMAEYLLAGEQMLHDAVGVRFGAGFRKLLADGNWVSQSEPPCRAVVLTQRLFGSSAAFQFGDELIRGFYEDGRPPDQPQVLRAAATQAGVDADRLLAAWDKGPAETAAELGKARESGVRIYPSVFLKRDQDLRPIYEGFAKAAELKELVDEMLLTEADTEIRPGLG